MGVSKTLAYVLKTQDYRDTSLLGRFYTRDFGKIHGIVRGIRDGRVRYGSTLEPFSLNEIVFYRRARGGDLRKVTQVELISLYPEVRRELERLATACYFIELLDQQVEVEDPSPAIFDLLRDSLDFLSSGASAKRCARIFEIKLFQHLGLMPEVNSCVACRAEHPDPAFFDVSSGGIRCRSCRTQGAAPILRGTLHFLDRVRRTPVGGLHQVKVSGGVGEELEKTLQRFVAFHLHAPLRSAAFMEKLLHP